LSGVVLVAAALVLVIAGQLARPGVASSTAGDERRDSAAALVAAGPGAASVASVAPAALPFDDRLDRRGTLLAPPSTLTGYRWPLEDARITQGFGPATGGSFIVGGRAFHDGIDIANFCGDPIVAAHDGKVIAAGRGSDSALGWIGSLAAYRARLNQEHRWGTLALVVVIDDGNGYRSIYAHFHKIVVKVGQVVHAGDLIGTEGATGYATGCHLHYGIFSPEAAGRFETDPTIVARSLLPTAEIARIDPLIVLPAMATASITWGWGARDLP
jgi:murein DD-endopeptidase MepM/ murein hydrolase activator NlpD